MKNLLKENEVLDDLQLNNLMIIQNKNNYRFTSDSVLLSNFVKVGHKDIVVEFCSGSGVISILVNEKYKPKNIIGFELQSELCEMSNRTLLYNNITNIKFINKDLSLAYEDVGNGKVDVLICNPPYYIMPEDNSNINKKYMLTKYEVSTSLNDIFNSANKILKYSGKFFMVHIPSRIQEIMSVAKKYNFICKKLQFLYPNNKKELSHLILCYFTKGGNNGCDVIKPNILK